MYHLDGGLRSLERHGHNTSPPADNAFGLLDLRSPPQTTDKAEPLVASSHPICPPNSTGNSTPTTGSSTGEVPSPVSEAEPPTQSLMRSSVFTYDGFLGSHYNDNDWEADSIFNPNFDLFSMTEL